ncbi:MAG: PDZ domain-containing protein [Owenweeksia sp.]|nr:PDZ domain-containing protein [Owenweeksia sp.]
MPDYMYQEEGMRIDGVTDGKPASEAGLQKGDVVVEMGGIKVVDMMSYMKALSQFKKGESTEIKYTRGDETITTQVSF